jgi:hypothetical protein
MTYDTNKIRMEIVVASVDAEMMVAEIHEWLQGHRMGIDDIKVEICRD